MQAASVGGLFLQAASVGGLFLFDLDFLIGSVRRESQLKGIAKAKAAGVYQGRRPSIDAAVVQELKARGLGPSKITQDRPGVGLSGVGFINSGHLAQTPQAFQSGLHR